MIQWRVGLVILQTSKKDTHLVLPFSNTLVFHLTKQTIALRFIKIVFHRVNKVKVIFVLRSHLLSNDQLGLPMTSLTYPVLIRFGILTMSKTEIQPEEYNQQLKIKRSKPRHQ